MFGVGFFEILVIAVLGLLVFGPKKLPEAIRTFAFGFSKLKKSWHTTRRELEQELGMDEIRREIHNASVMEELEKISSKTALHGGSTDSSTNDRSEKTLDESIVIAAAQKADDQFPDEAETENTIEPPAEMSDEQKTQSSN